MWLKFCLILSISSDVFVLYDQAGLATKSGSLEMSGINVVHFTYMQNDSIERIASVGLKEEPVTSSSSGQAFETYGPGKRGNQLVALASVTVAVGLFLSGRLGGAGPGLSDLAASAISYQEVYFHHFDLILSKIQI
jgi:hypothetical protein